MKQHKHLHLAQRKMRRVIDEIYTVLLRAGSREVCLRIVEEEDGLRLYAAGDFAEEKAPDMKRMGEMLRPDVRSPAMVEEFWGLAGGDPYTSDSELALVGQMVEEVELSAENCRLELSLLVPYE